MAIEVKNIYEQKKIGLVPFVRQYFPKLIFNPKIYIPLVILAIIFTEEMLAGAILLIIVFLFFWPLIKVIYLNFIEKRIRKEIDAAFGTFVCKEAKFIDTIPSVRLNTVSGSGIAYDNRTVYIMDHGLAAKIPWEDIREWKTNVDGYEKTVIYGGGAINNMTANAVASIDNKAAKAQAYQNSGFFITVADINYPKWQFMTDDEKVLSRWFEIFNQVKEGLI